MAKAEFLGYRERSRDIQDSFERHVWGKKAYSQAGSTISVRGTDTLDQDAGVLNTGYGFNLPENSNAEVFLVALGSDTNQKMAILSLPRDKQREWPENAGGVQHPGNPDLFLEINDDGVILQHGKLTLGKDGGVTVEVDGDDIKITGNLTVDGTLKVTDDASFTGGSVVHNGTNIGDTHKHPGVETGLGITGEPV